MAVLAGIAHAHHPAVGHADPAGPLHLQEEGLDRIVEPGDLEPASGEEPALDLGPGAPDGAVLQLGRTGIDRPGEAGGADGRAIQLRLVIAGEEGRRIAHLHRPEEELEELACGFRTLGGLGREPAERLPVRLLQEVAGLAEGGERRGVIVLRPAVERLELQNLRRRGAGGRRHGTDRQRTDEGTHHSPVATSCQFGSFAPMRRSNVQTSR